jgi:hypothetical protein
MIVHHAHLFFARTLFRIYIAFLTAAVISTTQSN